MSLSLQDSATSTCQDSQIVSVVGVSGSDATAHISTASPVLVGSKRQAKKTAHKKTPKLGVTTRTRARMSAVVCETPLTSKLTKKKKTPKSNKKDNAVEIPSGSEDSILSNSDEDDE